MAKIETCDVYLPALGVCLAFVLHGRKWTLVGSIDSAPRPRARSRRPRNTQPIEAFARHRSHASKRHNLH